MARPAGMSRASITGMVLAAVAVAAYAGVRVGWASMRAEWAEPPPPARYDEVRDLPPLPSEADNGWTEIASAPEGAFDGAPFPHLELFGAADDGMPPVDTARADRAEIDAWPVEPEAEARIDRALARPRFAIACPLDMLGPPCSVLPTLRALRIALGLALRDVLDGRDERGLSRATRVVVAARDLIVGARTLLEGPTAELVATAAIEVAALLGALVGARTEPPDAAVGPAVDALDVALRALDPATWSMERSLIGEAVRVRRSLEAASNETMALGDAMRESDAYYASAVAYARDPASAPRPVLPPEPSAWAQRLDPGDSAALSVLDFDAAPLIDHFRERAERSIDRVEVARVALAAARARAGSL